MQDDWFTPDICDDNESAFVLDFPWRSFGKQKFCGAISCVTLDSNNIPLKARLDEPGNHRVLLVWAGGSQCGAVVGDRVAGKAYKNGWAGLVIMGRIRDSEEIRDIDVGVFALGTTPRKLGRQIPAPPADLQELLTQGEGRLLYADHDGVIILP